jgi:ribosome-binding factor A
MPKDFSRTLRVGEQIRRELAVLLRDGVKDPRIGMVTITDVEVSRDLAHAKVYFTTFGNWQAGLTSKQGLESAAGFLRRELARHMKIRTVPDLKFLYDDTQQKGRRISTLIDQALSPDNRPSKLHDES